MAQRLLPRSRTIQQRFTKGELDPKLIGRTDIEQYTGAAGTMTNVLVMTQGGFKRRPGLEHIDKCLRTLTFVSAPTITLANGGTSANINDRSSSTTSVTTNNISTTDPYVVVQYDLGSAQEIAVVYMHGLKLTVSGTSSEFYIQCSNDAASWTTIGSALTLTTTEKNYSRRVEASYRYIRLARIGATDLSTNRVSIQDFNVHTQSATNGNIEIVDFQFNTEQAYILVLTDQNIAVYLNGVHQVDVQATQLTSAVITDINWAQSADTLIIMQEDMYPQILQRQGANDYWSIGNLPFEAIPYHAFTQTTQTGTAAGLGNLTPSAVSGTVTLTLSSGSWTGASIGQYVESNGGLARILSTPSSSVAQAFVEIPFYDTSAILPANWNYITGYEPAWSVTRGYPVSATFHGGRLWIGGSKSRPSTLNASRVGIFYDFSLGTSLDDDGIEITLDTDQLNRITNVYSGRVLSIFTSGAEFVIPTVTNEPITPSNVSALRQSRIGSQQGLRCLEVEGAVLYVQNGGQSVQEFVFIDTEQAFGNNVLSLLSNHLITNPVAFAIRRATSIDDGALLALVQGDGTATIATVQRAQQIAAFTNHTTEGSFIACGADYNDLYFIVEMDGVNYLQRFNDEHYLDSSVRYTTGLPATTFTGLDHLNGKECRVYADGAELQTVTVSGGSATISRAATESCEIGLWFQPIVVDLPTEFPEQKTVMGKLLNLAQLSIRLYNTSSLTINGKELSFRDFGSSVLDQTTPQFTGIKKIVGFRGWDNAAQVTITQDSVGPMAVLSMSKTVLQGE